MSITEQAAQLVAAGASSSIEAATWSITHKAGDVHGRSDAQVGTARDITGASEGYATGYARGYRWGIAHPLNAYVIPSMRSEEYGAALHAEAAAEGHQAGMWHDTSTCGFRH